jgi:hypothetical protein
VTQVTAHAIGIDASSTIIAVTNWRAVIENKGSLPEGLSPEDAVAELSEMLRSPDPMTRDQLAYTALMRLIPNLEPPLRHQLGDAMAERLTDPEIQARTFAPLVLDGLVEAGEFDPSWLAAFEAWYPSEQDLRGYDRQLGWLHAVAHGADLLGTFGFQRTEVAPERMLALAVKRLLAKTEYALRDQEDDRLAYAMALTLTREELTGQTATAWLDPVAADFSGGEPGPVPAHASNTMRTLRALYLLVDRGVRPNWGRSETIQVRQRDAVRQRLAEVLTLVAPFAG